MSEFQRYNDYIQRIWTSEFYVIEFYLFKLKNSYKKPHIHNELINAY